MVPSETVEKVIKAVNPAELIDLTATLVRMNSVWDPEAGTSEEEVNLFLAGWAEKNGFEVNVEEVAPQRPNVIVRHQGGQGGRHLMFEGHTDVVTPGDAGAWRHDPFGATIVGRRMYGRGTNDTKGNTAAMLLAMAALKRSGVPLAGRITGGVMCDEEGDGMLGINDFIRRGHADDLTAAIICEPEDGLVCFTQKGGIRARYLVRGRQSHGAMPLSGLCTAPAVAKVIEGLHQLESSAVEKLGRNEFLGWPSFTPTVLRAPVVGPGQLNVVPGEAEIFADIRTIFGQSHPRIIEDLKTLADTTSTAVNAAYAQYDGHLGLDRDHDLKVTVEIISDRPCTHTDRNEPIIRAVHWATQRQTGQEPVYAGVPGATDGTFLWALKNVPIVTIGAGDRQVPHQVDEWVDLDQLVETAKIYALSALDYLYPDNQSVKVNERGPSHR